MIYLYGLYQGLPDDLAAALEEQTGLQGPLQLEEITGWALVYSDHDDKEILPRRRLLLAHTKVLETMLPYGAVLPARFGLVAQDLDQVRDLVLSRRSLIAHEFDKVTGAVEIGIRVTFPKKDALDATLQANPSLLAERQNLGQKGPEAHFEIAEFGGRLADQLDRRRAEAQRFMLDQLRPLARDHVLRAPEDDIEVLRAEFLLDDTAQEAFQNAVAQAAASVSFAPGADPTIQVIGPVPMYNFVRLNLRFDNDQAAA